MASYASILSSSSAPLAPSSLAAVAQAKKPEASTVVSSSFTRGVETDLQKEIQSGLSFLRANGGTASDMLLSLIHI